MSAKNLAPPCQPELSDVPTSSDGLEVRRESDREASGNEAPIWPPTTPVLLTFIIAAGVILRWHLLTRRDLSDDEAASAILSRLPWSGFLTVMRNYEANMALYYLLLRGWLHLGDSEAVIRSLSVLVGVAAIPVTYLLGKRLFGPKVGMVSAGLAALNMFQIRYSQEARSYALVLLLSLLSTYFFVRAIEDQEGRKRYWAGYVVASALGVYGHVFFFLVVIAQWMSLGPAWLWRHMRTLLWTATSFLILTAPMIWFVLAKNQGQLNWVTRPTVFSLLEFAKLFTGYGGSALLAVEGALCLVAVFAAHQGGREGQDTRRWVDLVAAWLVFPVASTILISFVKPVFSDRFMAISAPALVLLVGKGIVDLEQAFPRLRWLFLASVALVAGLSLWGIHRYNSSPAALGDSWRLATRYVLARQQPGDGAFFYRASGSRPFAYYSQRAIEEHAADVSPVMIFPNDMTNILQFNVEPNQEQVRLALRGQSRVWLILQHWEALQARRIAMQTIRDTLGETYCLSQEQVFREGISTIRVVLYATCDAGSN
jgi:mannosyltransferase